MTTSFPKLTLRSNPLPAGKIVLRVTRHGDVCNYTLWREDKVESRYMPDEQMPTWLCNIVNAARVGGHEQFTDVFPPTSYVWCELDADRQLVRFFDKSQLDVS